MKQESVPDTTSNQLVCHELLLHLAGKLHDDVLWRYRDWLAAGAVDVLARAVPRFLLRENLDLAPAENAVLRNALAPHGGDADQIAASLGVDEPTTTRYTFTGNAPEQSNPYDAVATIVDAVLRDRPEVGEVRQTWRYLGIGGERDVKRVLLVTALSGWSRLTAELQRVLRVLGEEAPSVEVLPPELTLPEYHLAALAASKPVTSGAVDVGHRQAT